MEQGGIDMKTASGDHVLAQHIRSSSNERIVRLMTRKEEGEALLVSSSAWLTRSDLEWLILRLGDVYEEMKELEARDAQDAQGR